MSDIETVVDAIDQAQKVVQAYIYPAEDPASQRDSAEAMRQLLAILDTEALSHATNRLRAADTGSEYVPGTMIEMRVL
jgi:hypothetical protein